MKRLILFLLVTLFACAPKYTPKMVQHIRGSVFKATDHGYYTTELVMKPSKPVVGLNKARLIIHDYEGNDVGGLKIKVTLLLPSRGIQSPQKPKVEDAGRGLYLIDNIYFPQPGKWQLKLKIYGELVDTVTLPLPEVQAQ